MGGKRASNESAGVPAAEREEEILRARLAYISKRYTLSEIARRTVTPVSSVHRFLKRGGMPADFLEALVRDLGVSAAWLLTGEGEPFQADVQERPAGAATDMLELLRAMNAIGRMKLGELAGDAKLKVLGEFNEQVTAFEDLRAELNRRTRPLLAQLIEELDAAIGARDSQRAGEVRRAAVQASRLCDDEDLRRRLDMQQHRLEVLRGAKDRALEFQRAVFLRFLPRTELANADSLHAAYNFGLALIGSGRLEEARRVCRAALLLAPPELRRSPTGSGVLALVGMMDAELGGLRRSLASLERCVPMTPDGPRREAVREMQLRSLLYAGVVRLGDAWPIGEPNRDARVTTLCEFSSLREDAHDLELAHSAFANAEERGRLTRALVAALLAAKRGDVRGAPALLEQGTQSPWSGMTPASAHGLIVDACRAKVMRVCSDTGEAIEHCLHAQERLTRLPPEACLSVLIRAMHFHNVLALEPHMRGKTARTFRSDAIPAARRFFTGMLRRGYRIFGQLYEGTPVHAAE